jgi:hypothetical protein
MKFALSFLVLAAIFSASTAFAANNSEVNKDIAAARAASAKYHDINRAIADGYEPLLGCIPTEGYHYIKASLVDDVVDPTEPELLVYAPVGNGNKMKLLATEYVTPDTVEPIPSLFGVEFSHLGEPFNLYRLHAWVWEHNPNGMFEHENPHVSCPES